MKRKTVSSAGGGGPDLSGAEVDFDFMEKYNPPPVSLRHAYGRQVQPPPPAEDISAALNRTVLKGKRCSYTLQSKGFQKN